jgi:TPR repeat protein
LAPAAVVPAQTTTADGVEAFVRGDYQRAADILKPIAEKSPLPDYAARFLMGAMYENGLGVTADQMRACASYMRAALGRRALPAGRLTGLGARRDFHHGVLRPRAPPLAVS